MASVLVTGGAGFIGSHVVDAYISSGYDVTVLDNLSNGRMGNVSPHARFVHADVRSVEARQLVESGHFEIINHQAAQIDVRSSIIDPQQDAAVNLDGLLNLLQGARRGDVGRLILASSGGAIYADGLPLPLEEAAPKLPMSPYGVAKLASEYYATVFANLTGIETIALRYSNVYGPRQNPDGEGGVVAIFARRALAGESIPIYGNGEQTRDMVFVADVAEANLAAIPWSGAGAKGVDAQAFNIGTGIETSVTQLAELIGRLAGRDYVIQHLEPRPGEVRRSAISPSKAHRELGWQPRTSLSDGLRSTIEWLSQARSAPRW